jgi:hypothetical protein
VGEGGGTADDCGAIVGKLGDCLCGKHRENGHVDGNFVVEQANAPADGSAIVSRRGVDETEAGSDIDGIGGEIVVIEAHAEIQDEAWLDLPTVLDKETAIVAGRSGGEERIEINDFAAEGIVLAEDIDGKIGEEASVGGAGEGVTEREQMAAAKVARAKMKILRPLIEPGVSALCIEEGT